MRPGQVRVTFLIDVEDYDNASQRDAEIARILITGAHRIQHYGADLLPSRLSDSDGNDVCKLTVEGVWVGAPTNG